MSERKVLVYKWVKTKEPNKSYFEKEFDSHGTFHQFGVDYEELQDGPGMFTTAVVEMPDGSIRNLCVDLVVFNN